MRLGAALLIALVVGCGGCVGVDEARKSAALRRAHEERMVRLAAEARWKEVERYSAIAAYVIACVDEWLNRILGAGQTSPLQRLNREK